MNLATLPIVLIHHPEKHPSINLPHIPTRILGQYLLNVLLDLGRWPSSSHIIIHVHNTLKLRACYIPEVVRQIRRAWRVPKLLPGFPELEIPGPRSLLQAIECSVELQDTTSPVAIPRELKHMCSPSHRLALRKADEMSIRCTPRLCSADHASIAR
jgi:hypothetical protein